MFKPLLLTLTATLLLSACSSQPLVSIPGLSDEPDIDFSNQYLRGVFNWWEANPAYRLKPGTNGWYVEVELIADGQPYDFKLSDAYWTPDYTCGARYNGQALVAMNTQYLVCGSGAENLQFTPNATGVYRFTFNPASGGEVQLVVSRVSS